MRLYVATEALLTAKSFNMKQYKPEIDFLLSDIMNKIQEACKQGNFFIEYELDEINENAIKTFDAILKEMKYEVTSHGNKRTVSWG